jgi:hypothetical protein
VLAGDAVSEVSKLKERIEGDIVVYGSRPLVRMLMEHDLAPSTRAPTITEASAASEGSGVVEDPSFADKSEMACAAVLAEA